MGTGGSNKKYNIHQRIAGMINHSFQVVDMEFGSPNNKVDLLRNTQVPGVYLLKYDTYDVEIEIRIKPK